jgi:glutamate-1-semialdehyde 2,1-aminomutase
VATFNLNMSFPAMTGSSTQFSKAKELFPGGVNSPVRSYEPYPRYISKGKGASIYDIEGNSYTDYCLAYGPLILGHAHPSMKKALSKAAEVGVNFGAPTEFEIDLGTSIKAAIPAMQKMRFTSSGTEATMHAIRLARSYTRKKMIIKAEGCFHGSHDYALIKAGSGALTHGEPSSPGIPEEVAGTVAVAAFNDMDSFRSLIREKSGKVAAVIVEPVMGNAGVILPENGFLAELRELTSDNDILLIFDEVITGFRFHYGAYHTQIGVTPDLITLGKIIGGGLPIGAFGGRSDIMSQVSPEGKTYVSGTFSGNTLSMLGGIETLRVLKKADYSRLNSMVEKMSSELSDVIGKNVQCSVNHIGTMFQIFFNRAGVSSYSDAIKSDQMQFLRYFRFALDSGIYMPPSTFETNFVSFAHTAKDMERMISMTEEFFRQ